MMWREHKELIDRAYILASGLLIAATCYISYWLFINFVELQSPYQYVDHIFVFSLLVTAVLYFRRFSISGRLTTPFVILRELFICYVVGALGYGFCAFIFKLAHLSRVYLVGSMAISYLVLAGWFLATYWLYKNAKAHNLTYRNVLLVGNKYTLPDFIKTITENKALGLRIVGIMGVDDDGHKEFMGHKHFGSVQYIGEVLSAHVVDSVFFSLYRQNPLLIEKAILECEERGLEVAWKPDFMHKDITRSRVDYLQDIPLFVFSFGPKFSFSIIIKRVFDIVAAFFLLIILILPMLIVMIVVRATTHGPAIFKQKRVGLNGRRFVFYKFRTMYYESQERKAEYQLRNEMKGPVFKMKDDPRITPIGKFLRRHSIDELPQLWNVLIGDMSLVGPRPPLPKEVELYKGWQRRRLSMRPGITCFWQVMGRNKITDFEQWTKLDLKYIDEWSLWLDFRILLQTIPAVLKGTGL